MNVPAPSIAIEAVGRCRGAAFSWTTGDLAQVTAVVKTTVRLVDGGIAALHDARPILDHDDFHRRDVPSSVARSHDLAPFLPRAGVVLTGHAAARTGRLVEELALRLLVYAERPAVDKSLRVVGDRTIRDRGSPRPFSRIPVTYERAYGGPRFADNPVGVGAEDDARSLPNVLDPTDELRVAGFGPRSRYWGASGERLRKTLREADSPLALPADVSFDLWNVAPPDQTVAYLTGNEWIAIEGMNSEVERFQTRLPELRAEAHLEVGGTWSEVELVADTLHIDADALEATIVWRGQLRVDASAPITARGVVQVAALGERMSWPPGYALSSKSRAARPAGVPPAAIALHPPTIAPAEGVGTPSLPDPPAASPTALATRSRELPTYLLTDPERPVVSSLPTSGDAPAVAPPRLDEPATVVADGTAGAEDERTAATIDDDKRRQAMAKLSGQLSLADMDLAGADLHGLDFSGRDLQRANLQGARLRDAKLARAMLQGAVLRGADLHGANLAEADLTGADLEDANLAGADAREAVLSGAKLTSVQANEATFARAIARKTSFAGGRFSATSFEGADLREADLSCAQIDGATFAHAKLEGANLSDANGPGAIFNGALLVRANLNHAKLAKAFFVRVVAAGSTWEESELPNALFTEANLSSAHLGRADLSGADFVGANLSQARLRQARCDRADFSSADLSSARLQGTVAEGSQWKGAKLDGADLREAKLVKAELTQASLGRAWADRADLSDARLEGADLHRCSMRSAKLVRADLRKANLQACDLRDADLTGARGEGANTANAKLTGAKTDGFRTSGDGDE